jgi:hypothetical protein
MAVGPDPLEREQALRPRAQQEGVIVALLALGEADRQPDQGFSIVLFETEKQARDAAPADCLMGEVGCDGRNARTRKGAGSPEVRQGVERDIIAEP